MSGEKRKKQDNNNNRGEGPDFSPSDRFNWNGKKWGIFWGFLQYNQGAMMGPYKSQ